MVVVDASFWAQIVQIQSAEYVLYKYVVEVRVLHTTKCRRCISVSCMDSALEMRNKKKAYIPYVMAHSDT